MPNFNNAVDPQEKNLKETNLLAKLQQCICDEYEASARYRQIADRVEDPTIKKLIIDIADEELVHVGEFRAAIKKFFPNFVQLEITGEEEAGQIIGAPEVTNTGDEDDETEDEGSEAEGDEDQNPKQTKGKTADNAQQHGKTKKYRIVGNALVLKNK